MPKITKEPVSIIVEEGGEALIDCTTEGLPKPRVYWVFNGHNVHEDGNVQITGMKLTFVSKAPSVERGITANSNYLYSSY